MTALITGASAGIGFAFAKIFAQKGYDLVLVARSTDKLKQLASELTGVKTYIISKDLSLPTAAQEVYDEVKAQGIQIDVLVNNAGIGGYGLFHDIPREKQIQMIDLNVRALTDLTHLFGADMVARRAGKILNVASTASFQSGPLMSVYFATKHFVLAFSEGLANEWKNFGVTVTTLCPGATESDFFQAAQMEESKLVKNKKIPTSQAVAEYGYKALMRGQVVAVHGTMNWLLAMSVRFIPRWLSVRIVRSMQEKA